MNNRKYFLGDKINVANANTLKALTSVNPKYAEHMYYKNRIVEAFAMSHYGGVQVLESPMCGKCEQPGWYTDLQPGQQAKVKVYNEEKGDQWDSEAKKWFYDKFTLNCACIKCGTVTKDTITLKEYLMQELKLPKEILQGIEKLQYESEENQ